MLEELLQIQAIDLEIDRIEQEVHAIPEDLLALRRAKEELDAQLRGLEQQLGGNRREVSQAEAELADYQDKLNRARGDQERNAFDSKLQTQYENLIHQLSDRIAELEEEVLTPLYERSEQLQGQLARASSELESLAPQLEQLEQANALRVEALQGEQRRHQGEREALSGTIDRVLLREYTLIRRAKKGAGVALVVGGRCGGCNMHLPVAIQQRAAAQRLPVVKCPSCGRILVKQT